MHLKLYKYYLPALFILPIVIASCKKPYDPPIVSSTNSYLVVEGLINSGSDSTIIRLSHTVKLTDAVTTNPEVHAQVSVESEQNASFALTETSPGKYVAAVLGLDNTKKYRLKIKTSSGTSYASDLVPVVVSPPIDSVNFTIQSDGINILSNTHDPKNNTRYYRWDYVETWMIQANFKSFFKSNGDTVLGRDLTNDDIYNCWQSRNSNVILLGSSAKLAQDVITNNPITFVSKDLEKLNSEYSIIVRQYALTADGYNFYQNIKKNTEQLGSIFDAQPSQLKGNIHNTANAAEPVIGYVSIGTTTSKRIFVRNTKLPAWPQVKAYPDCVVAPYLYKYIPPGSKVAENQVDEHINYNKGASIDPQIPVNAIGMPGSPPIGYTATERVCVDCTLRGTNKQPSFWVY